MTARPAAYHPWRELRDRWPEVEVRIEPLPGDLLGELRYPVISLRAGTSAAQRRCTLTHELVHLERGAGDCGRWAAREEHLVHAEVARRLVPIDLLIRAIRDSGGTAEPAALAALLDVDTETLVLRVRLLTRPERSRIRARTAQGLWAMA